MNRFFGTIRNTSPARENASAARVNAQVAAGFPARREMAAPMRTTIVSGFRMYSARSARRATATQSPAATTRAATTSQCPVRIAGGIYAGGE